MIQGRRSLIAAIGSSLSLGLGGRVGASQKPTESSVVLRFRPFEEAVSEAFKGSDGQSFTCRRIEVGLSERVRLGVQGTHNDRPFAGFPAGRLRIVRTGSEAGPEMSGVRLYVSTVDVILTDGQSSEFETCPLDFASLPDAPAFS